MEIHDAIRNSNDDDAGIVERALASGVDIVGILKVGLLRPLQVCDPPELWLSFVSPEPMTGGVKKPGVF